MIKKILAMIILLFFIPDGLFSQSARQWIARFAGNSKNGDNAATAMVVDRSGNVIVAGWVTNKTTGVDIGTVKYTSDGEKLWDKYYSQSGTDKARSIAVDTSCNVYVAGSSDGGGSGLDYVILKYDSLGNQIWANRYNGSGNGEDIPCGVAVNDSFNVFVSGWSLGTGTGFDFATLKYDALGILQWEKRYNNQAVNGADSALDLSLRGNTDLFITGTSVDSGYDYFTIKYLPTSGDSVWSSRYNGSGNGNDIARAVYAKSSSEIYVTGGSQNSGGNSDYATLRLDATGAIQWISRYDGPAGGDDQAFDLATHSTNRLYVTGYSLLSGTFNDILTIRYNSSSGEQIWDPPSAYNGTANDEDRGISIIGGGNPYVLGSSRGSGVGLDYVLLKYDAGGDEDLGIRYNSASYNDDDVPTAMAEDDGAVYVTGTTRKKKGSDFLTIKFVDPEKVKYRSFIQDSLAGKAAKLTSSGTVPNAANVRDEAVLRAYPKIKRGYAGYPGGLTLGNARRDSASTYGWIRFDKGNKIAKFVPATGSARWFDSYDGGPFVGEKKNPKLEKYDNHLAGELVALRINIGASDAEVTPQSFGDLVYNDLDTSNHYNGLTLRQIAAYVDNYLTYGNKYPDVNWALLDTILGRVNRSFIGPGGALPYSSKVPLFVTGVEIADSIWFLQPAIAPVLEPLAFEKGSLDLTPGRFSLNQNYPNPFNPATTISFELPEESFVTLKIYDILGREIGALLEDELMDEGNQEILFNADELASGTYFYRIIVNDGQYLEIRKMLLLK